MRCCSQDLLTTENSKPLLNLQRGGGQVKGEWKFGLVSCMLELFKDYKVPLVVKDQQVAEIVKEKVKVGEVARPWLGEVDQV